MVTLSCEATRKRRRDLQIIKPFSLKISNKTIFKALRYHKRILEREHTICSPKSTETLFAGTPFANIVTTTSSGFW